MRRVRVASKSRVEGWFKTKERSGPNTCRLDFQANRQDSIQSKGERGDQSNEVSLSEGRAKPGMGRHQRETMRDLGNEPHL